MTLLALLPPEMRLLLAVARPEADGGEVLDAARAVRSWSLLLMLAERERALGTLWRRVSPHASALDRDAVAQLRRVALVEGFRGRQQRVRLAAALRTLRDAGIPVMLLKGAALATSVYPSFDHRAMSDLDVLLRPGDAVAAMRALQAAGWRHDSERYPAEIFSDHQHLPPLADGRHGAVLLEPHVSLFAEGGPFRLGVDELWRDARPVQVDGADALVPSLAHLAVHACTHLAWSHALGSGGWRTLRDLRALVEAGRLDWSALVGAARLANAETYCYWPLLLARATSILAVPDDVLRDLQPGLPAPMRHVLARHFALQLFSTDAHCPSTRVRRALWTLALQPAGPGRPWSREDRFARYAIVSAPVPARPRRTSAWGNYLRLAIGGRGPARG